MTDYIIVGLGLAGLSFCETLERNNKTYKVFNDGSQVASLVAGGLYNPVILKRFTMAWNGVEQLESAMPFYASLEKKFGVQLDHKLKVYRRFASIEEQNVWFEASERAGLSRFLSHVVHPNTNQFIDSPFGYGEVLGTGRIETKKLLLLYHEYLQLKGLLVDETFDYQALKCEENHVVYKSFKARNLVFAEGFGLKKNPYFKYLPMTGTKGEYLCIKAPLLKEKNAIKASIFMIPEGNDVYRIGATYKWKDTSNEPTEQSKTELLKKLDTFLRCNYEVVGQVAGIRPTVTDRKPLVGKHPKFRNLYVLNGFGSRGVMIAPYASAELFGLIERNESIRPEMDIIRFEKKYFSNLNSQL